MLHTREVHRLKGILVVGEFFSTDVSRTQLLFSSIQRRLWGFSSRAWFHPEYSRLFRSNYIEYIRCRVRPNASVARELGCVAIETCKGGKELNSSRRSQHGKNKGSVAVCE
jgi:hypothetical protein